MPPISNIEYIIVGQMHINNRKSTNLPVELVDRCVPSMSTMRY